MRIRSKRITKLRKFYKPRAAGKRLRLNDKTIRRLERERIREKASFDNIYKQHIRHRVNEAEWRLRKRFGITKEEAHELREYAIKHGLTYQEAYDELFEALFTWFLSFYDVVLDRQKKWPKAIIEYTSPFYSYTGPLEGFSISEAKRPIDLKYGKDVTPYWGLAIFDLIEYFEQFDNDGNLVLLRASLDESKLADFTPLTGD